MAVNYKQLGTSGLNRHGGYVYEEFLPELRWPRAGRIYKEMSDNDPVVGAILYMAEMMIRKVTWTVEAGGETEVDKEVQEFVASCMDDLDVTWDNVISEILSMLAYGFSFHEIVYKIRRGPDEKDSKYRSKYTDGRIGWKKLPIRSQTTLDSWIFDDDGSIRAFVQNDFNAAKMVEIPLSKGLLFRTRVQRDNPEGKSLLRNAYRPWYFKKHIEEIEGIGIERDLAGFPVLQAPEGMDLWNDEDSRMVALRTNAETLVKNIRRDSEEGVLLPFGWDLKLLSSGSARQYDTNAIINRYDNRIAITMLSDFILMGSDKTGSFAMAETKQSMLSQALEAQIKNIADTFNKYAIPKLLSYNTFVGMTGLPKIVPGEISSPSIKEIALLLRAMGLNISKDMPLQNYLRKITNLPTLSQAEFEAIYYEQANDEESNNTKPDEDNYDDPAENDFEQNDQNYTGDTTE